MSYPAGFVNLRPVKGLSGIRRWLDMTNLLESLSSKVGAIVEIAKTLGNAELMLEIGELQMRLADLKIEHAALKDENRELKAEAENEKNNPLVYDGEVYRCNDGHAFCPGCHDGNRKRVHLKKGWYTMGISSSPIWNCPICKNTFSRQDN